MYRSIMSKERFAFLLRALRFDEVATREDRLAPIRKLWNDVVQHCQEYYQPGPYLTIDEQLLAFRMYSTSQINQPSELCYTVLYSFLSWYLPVICTSYTCLYFYFPVVASVYYILLTFYDE